MGIGGDGAEAATHTFRGCVLVEDTLDSPEISELVGVANVPIEVYYEVLGVFIPMIGSMTTNSSGCFSGELRGFTVPRETQLRLKAVLKDSRQGVADTDGSTYLITLDTRTVVEGTREEFGDLEFTRANSSNETHGSLLMWVAQNRAIELFQTRGGGAWDFSKRLWVYFPADQEIATGGESGLRIPLDTRDKFSSTFLHELGHFISHLDVLETGSHNDYCAEHLGGSYPKDRPPYTYSDPIEQSGPAADCGHGNSSYGYEDRAIAEGFADAVSDYLSDAICGNENEGGNPLNFDGTHRELNFKTFLCRAIDRGTNRMDTLHVYGQSEKHLRWLGDQYFHGVSYIDGDQVFVAHDKTISRIKIGSSVSLTAYLQVLMRV